MRRAVASSSRRVRTLAQTARLTVPATASTRLGFTAVAFLGPARASRVVALQRSAAGRWSTVVSSRESPSGRAVLRVPPASVDGRFLYRARAAGFHGAPAAATTARYVVLGTSHWKSLPASDLFTLCGVKVDDSGWCMGDDTYGQVGNGSSGGPPATRQLPDRWAAVSTSGVSTCGVKTDHTGWCWGAGDYGQLGDGVSAEHHLVAAPRQVVGSWISVTTYRGINQGLTCGLQTDHTGWCWGQDTNGQVGDGTYGDARGAQPRPYQLPSTWRSLTSDGDTTCGVRMDDTGWCWGMNLAGSVGTGSTSVGVPTPFQLPGQWTSLAPGETTCGVRTDGSGWCWGYDLAGQVGDGTTGDPDQNSSHPGLFQEPGTWTSLATFGATTCGIRTDLTAWCWGDDGAGKVGNGAAGGYDPVLAPSQLPGTWSALAGDDLTMCGIHTDGTGWCWGDDSEGQVGDGPDAVQVKEVPTRLPGLWSGITVAGGSPCGIRTDQTGWCWGVDYLGKLMDRPGDRYVIHPSPYGLP
jgi:alpha-tubulin suppressor-like RCC1 family protein